VVVAHRRLGKTTLANNELIRAACTRKGNYFYVAPTYRQAKLISWDIFKHYAIPQIVNKVNESELYIEFVNGSKILLKGADSPDCYDDKTQISTRTNGWKYFKAQLSASEKAEYTARDGEQCNEEAKDIILLPYDGKSFKLNPDQFKAVKAEELKRKNMIYGRDMKKDEIVK